MPVPLPSRPVGSTKEARYHQQIWDVLKSLKPMESPNILTNHTTIGITRTPNSIVETQSGPASDDLTWLT